MGLGLPLGCLWGALGATLGTKKATKEAPRRVTEPFGDPTGLWKSPGVILEVVLGSKKGHFEVSKPQVLLVGRMKSQYFGFSTLDTKMDDFGFILGIVLMLKKGHFEASKL